MNPLSPFIPPAVEEPLLLDILAVAALLDISDKTVARMVKDGKFVQPIRMNKRNVRWSRVAVEGWIAEQTAAAAVDASEPTTLSLVTVSED